MNDQPLYRCIARWFVAWQNCIAREADPARKGPANLDWARRHRERVDALIKNHMPSGGGFDNGTRFDWKESKPDRLVFETAFHHMNENGMYNGWSEHTVIVTPSLGFDFEVRVTGKDRNDIKDEIAQVFHDALLHMITAEEHNRTNNFPPIEETPS